jgi:mRNA interferase RelE/StbE
MKIYTLQYSKRAIKELSKLDRYTRQMIYTWIGKHLVNCENPRAHGKALTGDKHGQWRYRIGDYRLICHINDNKLVILAINIGHRRSIYD